MEPSMDWKQKITSGIEDVYENLEMLGVPFNFDPVTIIPWEEESEPFDGRSFGDLNPEEKAWVSGEVLRVFAVNLDTYIPVAKYTYESPDDANWTGVATVEVLETMRSKLEDIYLHKLSIPGIYEPEYIIAGKDFQL